MSDNKVYVVGEDSEELRKTIETALGNNIEVEIININQAREIRESSVKKVAICCCGSFGFADRLAHTASLLNPPSIVSSDSDKNNPFGLTNEGVENFKNFRNEHLIKDIDFSLSENLACSNDFRSGSELRTERRKKERKLKKQLLKGKR
jgi:hypothetical protein